MNHQVELADLFARLHVPGKPLILYNAWDPGSARAVATAGAAAIATGSWSVAAAHGYEDGEKLPLELALANAVRVVAAVDVPVSVDFEGGYAAAPSDLQTNAAALIGTGAVGINFEDGVVNGTGLYPVAEQAARIAAVRATAERSGVPLFINARTDLFLNAKPDDHRRHLDDAVARAAAYADAGASGFFVPGLADETLIRTLCERVALPVNVMVPPAPEPARLAPLGVARVSYGPAPFLRAMESITAAAREALVN